jgi:hypothetical protein
LESLGEEIGCEFWLDNLEASVDKDKAAMDAVHGAADIPGTLARDEVVEEGKGFDFAARCVEKRRA